MWGELYNRLAYEGRRCLLWHGIMCGSLGTRVCLLLRESVEVHER